MSKISLSFAGAMYDRLVPLATGEVQTPGLSVNFVEIEYPREVFDRIVGNREFDASDFCSSEYITRVAAGDPSFVAIPAFPSRSFRHSFIFVNTKNITESSDLNGKRIGLPLYTMTAAIWIRGLLMHDYGVGLSTTTWIEGSVNKAGGYGQPAVFPLVNQVSIASNTSSKSLSQLLAEGDTDAIINPENPQCFGEYSHIQRLFPNYKSVEKAYFQNTGIFPMMHLVVLRRDLRERHRFIATSLYKGLVESKALALRKMQ